MSKQMNFLLILLCLLVAPLRLVMPSHGLHAQDIFKDFAHLFVGGLFGAAIALKTNRLLWILAVALTVLETAAALMKGH